MYIYIHILIRGKFKYLPLSIFGTRGGRNRWVPSFFFTKITRLAQEEEEGLMIPFSSISSICLDTSASISGETRNGWLLIGRSSRRVIMCSAVPISCGLFGFSAKTSFHLDSTLRMAVSSRGDSFGFISNLASKLSPSFPIFRVLVVDHPPHLSPRRPYHRPQALSALPIHLTVLCAVRDIHLLYGACPPPKDPPPCPLLH